MAISKTVGVGLAVCFLLGAAAGGIGGWHSGHDFMLDAWVQEQAGDVKERLDALQKLRSGNTNEAIEFLESRRGIVDEMVRNALSREIPAAKN